MKIVEVYIIAEKNEYDLEYEMHDNGRFFFSPLFKKDVKEIEGVTDEKSAIVFSFPEREW